MGDEVSRGVTLAGGAVSPELETFIETKSLRPLGEGEREARQRLAQLQRALYTTADNFQGHVAIEMPPAYSGPRVAFQGTIYAEILANAFHANVHDLAAKVGEDGAYHTSTQNAPSWGGYNGFGTFRRNLGK